MGSHIKAGVATWTFPESQGQSVGGNGTGARVLAAKPPSGEGLRGPTCSAGKPGTGSRTEDPAWGDTQKAEALGLSPWVGFSQKI